MRILLTNDDGVDSPGIAALVEALRGDHEAFVVAPSRNQSGMSHAVTTHGAITIERLDAAPVLSYACSGTPADCVFLAINELNMRPELVVSGVNLGPNLADDVNYSGTVAGAMEAALLGVPALAVSMTVEHEQAQTELHWETAAEVVRRCAHAARERLQGGRHYWNLNVPNVAIGDVLGIAITQLGRKRICGRMVGEDVRGERRYYRAWESPFAAQGMTVATDIGAVHAGYASITPLLVDRTAHAALAGIADVADLMPHPSGAHRS